MKLIDTSEVEIKKSKFLGFLYELDSEDEVKVILATNRIESLDPALIRPGRIDRKIFFPLPDSNTKRRIFQIHTQKMSMSDDVNLEEFIMAKDELSGADIKAIAKELPQTCQTIMFSATMPEKIEDLAKTLLKNPIEIKLAVSKPAE